MPNTVADVIHVAVAIIMDQQGRVLLARRPDHVDFAGKWEFPGGKLESGETIEQALMREIDEELDIRLEKSAISPLIQIPFTYPHRQVHLYCCLCRQYDGQARGREGQQLSWKTVAQLTDLDLPPANRGICTALQLPAFYMIAPEPEPEVERFLDKLSLALATGVKLLQLRSKKMARQAFYDLALKVKQRCEKFGTSLLLNSLQYADIAKDLSLGLHLTSLDLQKIDKRPISRDQFLAASCHNETEINLASQWADFLVVSPVFQPKSHQSDLSSLTWNGLHDLIKLASIPAYALGGLEKADLTQAQKQGAQGIAAISAFWPK